MSVDDAALIRRWRSDRDGEAFAELVARYSGLVYSACRRVTRDNGRSEDLTQECFLTLARSRPIVKGSLGPWLHRVATNLALDEIRASDRRARREKNYMMDKVESAEPEWSDIEPIVDEAVQALPDLVRVPILLHFYEGRTQEAIAELTDAPRSTVANRIKRGVEEVRKFLRRRGVEIPAAALTAFLTTELATAAPAGLTTSIGKAALAGRLPKPVASGVSWAGRIAMASAIVAVIGLIFWLRPEGSDALDTLAADEAVQAITVAPPIPVDDGMVLEAELDEAVEAPPVKEVQPAIAPAPEDDAGPSVSGTITQSSGAPVPGALVRLMPKDAPASTGVVEHYLEQYGLAYTDADGIYTVSDIQLTGQVIVAAVAPGFLSKSKNMTVETADDREGIDFVLEESHDFAGRVLDSDGKPIQGALVVPLEIDRNGLDLWRRWRLTDENGMFYLALQRVADAESGVFRSQDWKDGLLTLEVTARDQGSSVYYDVFLTSDEVSDFRLPPPATLSGMVATGEEAALPNYTIMFSGVYKEVVNPGGDIGRWFASRRQITTDEQGRYTIEDLAPYMKYFISLKDQDGEWVDTRTIRESPFLKPGSSTRFDIEANIGVMLAGDVLGANSGMPIKASVNIVVFDAETGEPAGTGFSMDGASSYKMRLPGSGSYLLGATYLFFLEHDEQMAFFASGNDDKAPVRVEVGVGGTRADVTVPEPFALPVRVVTADGDPVESASLNLSRMHPGYVGDRGALSTPRRANREGRYTWYAMPGREVWISATNPGFSIARTPHFVGEPGEVSPEIELILRKPGDIFGQIVTPDGKLITSGDLNISVSNGQGQRILGTDFTVDDGIFFLPGILKEDRILVTIMYNHREIWTEPYVHEGPADVDLDFGDITVWPEP